jgi:hypothetical protein
VHVAVHQDEAGTPRVAFVMNPTSQAAFATVSLGKARALVDLAPRARMVSRIEATVGAFGVEIPARTARIFAIER